MIWLKGVALAEGYLCGRGSLCILHKYTNTRTYTHIHTHKHTQIHIYTYTHIHIYTYTHIHIYKRLSPELYDNIIRIPIPISSGVLMMIGVLPMHPSPHVSLICCWLVDGIGSLLCGLYRASMRSGGRLYSNVVGLMLVGGVGAAIICVHTCYGCGDMSL